jgi:cellobiose phosphorylase
LDLYIDETGDFGIFFEEASYFRDHRAFRSAFCDYNWDSASGNKLKTKTGKIYAGSVLEHLLAENLVEFFNVGIHNHIRLEGADWNDGLDMACEKGESVAFSCMYAYNLELLSRLLLKIGQRKIKIARELKILLANINNHDAKLKQRVLQKYFERVKLNISGKKFSIDSHWLAFDLKVKSVWLKEHIRKTEWLKEGFFNGYYDNTGRRVEGKKDNITRMILSSQVLAILSGTAEGWRVRKILENTEKYLMDKKLKSYHLNTDFKEEQHNLGRAFSFVYGDKENGAFFNHMIVMFAYALYRQGRVKEGWKALSSIYNLAMHTQRSNIYPCLPEYFNLEGRGMYSYLTGSASWFVLTIRTEVFGIKGKDGNLLIEPKLCPEQFQKNTSIGIDCIFAGKQFKIEFCNPKRLSFGKYNITEAVLNKHNLILKESPFILIDRKTILGLAQNKVNNLAILLG